MTHSSPSQVDPHVPARKHWEELYERVVADSVNWYQELPEMSLALIETFAGRQDAILDVGGGGSNLVDVLLERGFNDLTILDIAEAALQATKIRLGDRAEQVSWLAADITALDSDRTWDLWHDRAMFHFLTDSEARKAYVVRLKQFLRPGGIYIISTFSVDGPCRCAGLDTLRYDTPSMLQELGDGFSVLRDGRHAHRTPRNEIQEFWWGVFQYLG